MSGEPVRASLDREYERLFGAREERKRIAVLQGRLRRFPKRVMVRAFGAVILVAASTLLGWTPVSLFGWSISLGGTACILAIALCGRWEQRNAETDRDLQGQEELHDKGIDRLLGRDVS